MNTSQYMDKQIMDLSNSLSNNDFIDLLNSQDDHHHINGGIKGENVVPSYEFHPVRPIGTSPPNFNIDSGHVGGARAWNSAESKTNTVSTTVIARLYLFTCLCMSILRLISQLTLNHTISISL